MSKEHHIQMVDLQSQYQRLSKEINQAIQSCLLSAQFIQGEQVRSFEKELGDYISSRYTISCGNGTDALMLACIALGLQKGDKIIVPAFTYIATAEVAKFLGLEIIYCDVDMDTFMPKVKHLESAFQEGCKALMIVHLYGQSAEMSSIQKWAHSKDVFVIEDNAQAIGAQCQIGSEWRFAGTIGDIGITSFFPSKNLGAYGDGGAVFTQNEKFANQLRKLANHGQSQKYMHDIVGVNSRLDAIQAAILRVKLKYLDEFTEARNQAANTYDQAFKDIEGVKIPDRIKKSTHVFHQYTLRVEGEGRRDRLQSYLKDKGVPSVVYYPMPIYQQKAYREELYLPNTEALCKQVLSLPIHTEMKQRELDYICQHTKDFFHAG